MTKFYAVRVGRERGIFVDWRSCEQSVRGFPRCEFKSFPTRDEAFEYMHAYAAPPPPSPPSPPLSASTPPPPPPLPVSLQPSVEFTDEELNIVFMEQASSSTAPAAATPIESATISAPRASLATALSPTTRHNLPPQRDVSHVPKTALLPDVQQDNAPTIKVEPSATKLPTELAPTPDCATPAPIKRPHSATSLSSSNTAHSSAASKKPPKSPPPSSLYSSSSSSSSSKSSDAERGLSDEQLEAFRCIVHDRRSCFLTGKAGTGKSYLLRRIIAALPAHSTFCTASTGVAAAPLPRGTTVHYWWGCATGCDRDGEFLPDDALVASARRNRADAITTATHLIIDEISMVSAEFFTRLEMVVRRVRQSDRPFGGVCVIACGDFLQLPPVIRGHAHASGGTAAASSAPKFAFESPAWAACMTRTFDLQRVFRQRDPLFINLLARIRVGQCDEGCVRELVSRCGTPTLKARLLGSGSGADTTFADAIGSGASIVRTKLTPFNADVDENNSKELRRLDASTAVVFTRRTNVIGGGASPAAPDLIKAAEDKCSAPASLELRINAQVVLLRNLNVERQLVNGARGRVVDFVKNEDEGDRQFPTLPVVEFVSGARLAIGAECWDAEEPGARSKASGRGRGGGDAAGTVSVRQIPLKLAWSLTIHKCQGMSLDAVECDLSRCFEPGMAYVALSRCRSLAGLLLTGLNPRDVRADARVLQFMAQQRQIALQQRQLMLASPAVAAPSMCSVSISSNDAADAKRAKTVLEASTRRAPTAAHTSTHPSIAAARARSTPASASTTTPVHCVPSTPTGKVTFKALLGVKK